jgi:hypothetical protein
VAQTSVLAKEIEVCKLHMDFGQVNRFVNAWVVGMGDGEVI